MTVAGAKAGWSVSRWTRHPQAAVAFVNYLASLKVQQTLAEKIDVPAKIDGATVAASDPLKADYLRLCRCRTITPALQRFR